MFKLNTSEVNDGEKNIVVNDGNNIVTSNLSTPASSTASVSTGSTSYTTECTEANISSCCTPDTCVSDSDISAGEEMVSETIDEPVQAVTECPQETIVEVETNIVVESSNEPEFEYVGEFQATYYTAYSGACGGSGRTLIDCNNSIGSIASSTLYNMFGYYVNGRTTVYIECDSYPCLTGYYHVDDSTASWVTNTIDFYYDYSINCPFQYAGRLYGLRVYIKNN